MAWSEMEIARILIDRQVSRQIPQFLSSNHFGPRSQESPTFRQCLILSDPLSTHILRDPRVAH